MGERAQLGYVVYPYELHIGVALSGRACEAPPDPSKTIDTYAYGH
jgi:hypothetical protein